MAQVVLLDPAINSDNFGDQIISESVHEELFRILGSVPLSLPTQVPWTRYERRLAKAAEVFVVGGTNLLTSSPARYRQFKLSVNDLNIVRGKLLLFGVGWWQYQKGPSRSVRSLYRKLLGPDRPHAVRDGYTAKMLDYQGIRNFNVGCPTTWGLKHFGKHASDLPNVVATVTNYSRDFKRDSIMLSELDLNSRTLRIWPQSRFDIPYVCDLGFADKLISPGLASFEECLNAENTTYFGTRLHAGIRALKLGVPAWIVAIDNRATEIAKDINLPILISTSRLDFESLLTSEFSFDPKIPHGSISEWKTAVLSELGS